MTEPEDGQRDDEPSETLTEDDDPFEYSDGETGDENEIEESTERDTVATESSDTTTTESQHTTATESPDTAAAPDESDSPSGVVGWLRWFWTTDTGSVIYIRDVVTSVGAVLLVGLVLFAISGIWPPMVAVESGSMEPNMERGDLVFIVDNERFTPDEAVVHNGEMTGVVPADEAERAGRSKFNSHGDVIVFMPNGNQFTTPIIHRAMLWVDEGENWYDRADPAATNNADDCDDLNSCPAPHAGFITLGDANPNYDQETGLSQPVRPDWVIGTAEVKVPYLGHVRLAFSQVGTTGVTAGYDYPGDGDYDHSGVDDAYTASGDESTVKATAGSATARPVA